MKSVLFLSLLVSGSCLFLTVNAFASGKVSVRVVDTTRIGFATPEDCSNAINWIGESFNIETMDLGTAYDLCLDSEAQDSDACQFITMETKAGNGVCESIN